MYHVYNNLWNKTIVAPTTTTSDYHRGDMHSSIVRGWRVSLCVHPPTTKYLGILGSPCTNISVAHDTTMDSLVSLSLVQPARAVHQFGFGILLAHALPLPLLLCCVLVEHQRSVVAVKVQHSSTTDDRPPKTQTTLWKDQWSTGTSSLAPSIQRVSEINLKLWYTHSGISIEPNFSTYSRRNG